MKIHLTQLANRVALLLLALVLSVPFVTSAQTPVLFSMQGLTGQANNCTILIQPDREQNLVTFGTNLVPSYDFTIQPIGGQVITNLIPWGYTIRVDGWPRGVHIVVPALSPSNGPAINVVSLINTNQFSPLYINYGAIGLSQLPASVVTNGFGVGSLSSWLPPVAITSCVAFYNPAVFTSLGNGAYLPVGQNVWPDLSGNGNHMSLLGANYFLDQAGLNGKPAARRLYNVNNGVSPYDFVATNLFANYPQLSVSGTVLMIVYRADPTQLQPIGVGGYMLSDGSPGTVTDDMSIIYDLTQQSSVAGDGSLGWQRPSVGLLSRVNESLDGQTHVAIFAFNTSGFMDVWYDGMKSIQPSIFMYGVTATNNLNLSASLILGSYAGGQQPFVGDIGCIGIWSNYWSDAQIADLGRRTVQEYQPVPSTSIYLVGASIMAGGDAWDNGNGTGFGYQKLLALSFPTYGIYSFAAGSRTSQMELTNESFWLSTADTASRQKIAIVGSDMALNDAITGGASGAPGLINNLSISGEATQIVLTESNYVQICSNLLAHHITPILCTMPSWYGETNLSKNLWNTWVSNNWSSYAGGLFTWPTAMQIDGAYSGPNFEDGIHPKALGYQISATNIASAVGQALLSLQSPGILATVQPASSVLTQLTSLDDYMSIDQQDPYDVATALLPAVAGGVYVGVGKFDAPGGTAFYFNPPRWPMFQWSGFTNQVLYEHIFVTNAATINWSAFCRYFTNGAANQGFGYQQKNFASGILQCTSPTNDYWIVCTNNFPPSVMTNVTLAGFYLYNMSPSSNFWAIEGTRIHAQ